MIQSSEGQTDGVGSRTMILFITQLVAYDLLKII